jgi:hypothetical protein
MADDRQLLQQIAQIRGDLHLPETRAEVEDGVVYLEGVVDSLGQKQRLEQAVGRLPGVAAVVNCLAVEHPTPGNGYTLPGYPMRPSSR